MHRLAIKRTTKNELPPASQYTCNGVCRAASRHSAVRCDRRNVCRGCRVPTAVHVQRGVRTANLQTDFLFTGRVLCWQWIALKYCTQYERLSQQQLSFLF